MILLFTKILIFYERLFLEEKNTVKMRPQIPACVPSPAVLVVGWATAALVPSVGPWHLFLGGTEQKDCVCPHLSEGLPWAPASLGTRSGWEVVVLLQNIVRQTTFHSVFPLKRTQAG